MMRFFMKRLMILAGLLAFAGCDTTSQEIQREQVSQRATILELQERQDTLNMDLQGTQEENSRLKLQVEELRAELENSRRTGDRYEQDIARLDELLKKLNTARENDREVILDEVSKELARISSRAPAGSGQASPPRKPAAEKSAKLASATGSGQAASEQGYEHKVKKGETLFAIANAYKVPTSSILKANNLKQGAPLKTGQVLFIPKP